MNPPDCRTLPQRVTDPDAREPNQVPIVRPQLTDAMLKYKSGDMSVVNQVAANLAAVDHVPEVRRMGGSLTKHDKRR